ncbi:alkaline phosphatase PafA [Chitinophaga nivalis]|uniref:Alkaline phosphatase family protein n=1 Tax=Chitinophaga nivalis TaxID=2991709 RepID=A0ABT3IM50_9BACT|nr:alkaline phosphatase PafA [Chitinophaga nivalis]MCW3465285.1 alkaline phosphatase family protein [Chitinophaga nivalis]MCW3485023.1 alkaline phosphatase family protein [Chitinophaga nivalis]
MRISKILLLAILMAGNSLYAQQLNRPKLVVGIMVDQMRWDYLYRYYNRYGSTGFKRLLREGFSCEQTMINYVPTVTAAGHAAVYTGAGPAMNGIVGNDWYDRASGKSVYCVYDSAVSTIGTGKTTAGGMSPHYLQSTTVGDELRIGTGFQSRVIGIALKDRAAILPAGHGANAAFWYDDATGNFISSTWYMNNLPAWAEAFNQEQRAAKYIQQPWQTLYPAATYTASTADDKFYEVPIPGEDKPVFLHQFNKGKDYDLLKYSPLGNTLTLDFAKAAIQGYDLGKNATDLLALSFSTPDIAGHSFGPNAIEMEDMYLRLDKELGAFLSWLDQRYGKDYLVFLTADHGAVHSPGFLQDNRLPGKAEKMGRATALNEAIHKNWGIPKAILSDAGTQLYLDTAAISKAGVPMASLQQFIKVQLKAISGIGDVVAMDDLRSGYLPAPYNSMYVNGWHAKRSGDMMMVPAPGVKNGSIMGTTHGTMYPYDTHIPLVWFGWQITPGSSYRPVSITDIAPTLSALLHIQMPSGTTGQVITEVMPGRK